jgi:hypothetical protein
MIVPGEIDTHELAIAVIEALPVVFLKRERSVRAGMGVEGRRFKINFVAGIPVN